MGEFYRQMPEKRMEGENPEHKCHCSDSSAKVLLQPSRCSVSVLELGQLDRGTRGDSSWFQAFKEARRFVLAAFINPQPLQIARTLLAAISSL